MDEGAQGAVAAGSGYLSTRVEFPLHRYAPGTLRADARFVEAEREFSGILA